MLVAVALISLGILGFGALAGEVMGGETDAFDRAILLSLRNPANLSDPIGPPVVEEAMRDLTALGSGVVLCIITVSVAGLLGLRGQKHLALFLLAAVAGGALLSMLLKDVFHRTRPDLVPHLVRVSSSSFPSGHAMLSATVYLTIGALAARSYRQRALKVYVIALSVVLTVLVGISRVYLGVHWPTDVLGGWTAGAVWAVLCSNAAKWLQRRHKVEPPIDDAAKRPEAA